MLEIELATYLSVKSDLQSKFPNGGFIVIKGDKILGVWEKRIDALKAGYDECGNVNFFIRQI